MLIKSEFKNFIVCLYQNHPSLLVNALSLVGM